MKKTSNILLAVVSMVVMAWFLPWLLNVAVPSSSVSPLVAYSPITNHFIVSQTDEDKHQTFFELDENRKNTIKRTERDSLLPQIYYTILSGKDQMPDSVAGRPVSIKSFKENTWVFVSNPMEINRVAAKVNMIMESMPERLELEDATEVFRTTDNGIEFVDMSTNEILTERSARFTKMMKEEGFVFPITVLNANITSRKPYDEGYLMADANNRLYHVKMQVGRPYVHRIDGAKDLSVSHVFVTENADHRFLGVVTDTNNDVYMIEASTYAVRRLPFKWNPEKQKLIVMANMFNWVANVSNADGSNYFAIDNSSLSLLGKYEITKSASPVSKISSWLFPFTLTFSSTTDQYVYPRLNLPQGYGFVILNIVLALLMVAVDHFKRRRCVSGWVATLIFGIYAFIPLMIFRRNN